MADDLGRKGHDNQAKGIRDELEGRARNAAGGLDSDSSEQFKGKAQEIKGKVERKIGEAQRDEDRRREAEERRAQADADAYDSDG